MHIRKAVIILCKVRVRESIRDFRDLANRICFATGLYWQCFYCSNATIPLFPTETFVHGRFGRVRGYD